MNVVCIFYLFSTNINCKYKVGVVIERNYMESEREDISCRTMLCDRILLLITFFSKKSDKRGTTWRMKFHFCNL